MKFAIELTWSKLVAVLVLGSSVFLDRLIGGNATFMFALPFVVFLITGKQLIDWRKQNGNTEPPPSDD